MIAHRPHALDELQAALSADDDSALVRICTERSLRDRDLAELIDLDARWRLQRGAPVTLERYLHVVPDLDRRPISLDAAIEFSLRSASGGSRPLGEAVEGLIRQYPVFESSIRNAAALSAGLATTRTLRGLDDLRRTRRLPCDFGPTMRDGRSRYELTSQLGSGAQGDVFLAIDRALSEPDRPALAAIKVLASTSWAESDRWRLIDEATRARRVDHPNVVRVLDRGATDEGEEYVVYEYVAGGDLQRWLADHQLDARGVAKLLSSIGRGVQAAHGAGLVHRDLKPANVLMSADDEPKVADFGVATAVHGASEPPSADDRLGNLAFIAPEQFRGEPNATTALVDIYALGGMLYYACTGRYPNGDTADAISLAHRSHSTVAPPVDSSLKGFNRTLGEICRKALAPRPEDRYASADALANDLDAWIRNEPLLWTRPSPVQRMRLLVKREPRLVIAIAAAFLAVLLGASGTVYAWTRGAAKTELARREAELNKTFADSELKKRELTAQAIKLWRQFMLGQDGLNADDWFVSLTILESLTGPYFFDPRGAEREIWARRTRVAMAIVGDNHVRGQQNSMESLLWSDAAAYWMLKSGAYDGAETLLGRVDEAWECKLEPTDRWRDIRSALKSIAVVQHHKDKGSQSPRPRSDPAELRAAVAKLRELERRMSVGPQDDALHRFVLKTLVDAYAPGMLNQEEDRAWAMVRAMDVRDAAIETNATGNPLLDHLYRGMESPRELVPVTGPQSAK
jgi:hypothetical protein